MEYSAFQPLQGSPLISRQLPSSSDRRAALLGVFYAALFSAFLGVGWVIVRKVSAHIHPLEVTFWGNFFGFLVFVIATFFSGTDNFKTGRARAHFVRAAFNSGAILAWFWGLTLIPLADAAALNLIAPLLITVGAIVFFNETVGPRRWAALAIGAIGALVVVRPGFQEFDLGLGLVSVTIVFSAGQRLVSKSLSHTDPSITSVLYLMLFMLPFTLAASLPVWSWPTFEQLATMALLGLLLSLGHFAWMRALTYADISAIEPIGFTRLLWGALFGFLFFSEVPTIWTWIGGLMIIGATTYIARREASLRSGKLAEVTTPQPG